MVKKIIAKLSPPRTFFFYKTQQKTQNTYTAVQYIRQPLTAEAHALLYI